MGSVIQARIDPILMGNEKSNLFYTANILNRANYDFKVITYSSNPDYDSLSEGFPYGFIIGNNLNFNLSFSVKTFPDLYSNISIGITILSGSSIRSEFKFLLQFKIKINGFYPINTIRINLDDNVGGGQTKQTLVLKSINLISGSLLDGIWETIYDGVKYGKRTPNNPLQVFSFSGVSSILNINEPFSIESPTKLFQLPYIQLNNNQNDILEDLVNVTMLYDIIDVTNQIGSNILYFNFSNGYYKDLPIAFSLIDPKTLGDNNFDISFNLNGDTLSDNWVFAEWVNNRFQVKFKIPSNTMPGIINYFLIFTKDIKVFSSSLPKSAQLNIISNNIDIYGPIFSKIIKNPPNLALDTLDNINGLRNGYIIVRGTIDSSLHNFTIDPTKSINGDKWNGEYEIYIKENQQQCISQSYEITEVVLLDTFDNKASYIKFTENNLENTKYNPFINYLNDTTIGKSVTTIIINTHFLDVGSLNGRTVTFELECEDIESGIRLNQFPIIYLTTLNLEFHKCISTNSTPFQLKTKFTCTTTVPLGFGIPSGIIVSIHGLINNGGYYGGYATQTLQDLGMDYSISTMDYYTENQPIIKSTNTITNQENCGGLGTVNVLLKYLDDTLGGFIPISPTTMYDSFILIENIRPTNQSFIIKISNSTTDSNEFIVTPILFYFNIIPIEPTTSPSVTPSVTPTTSPTEPTESPTLLPIVSPIPTNPPQKCQGNPECGGPNQGICKDGGCICYPPFIGISCTLQTIIVPPPTINNTNPSTEIIIPPSTDSENIGNNVEKLLFKSLISLVSLRELGKEIQLFNFEKWIYTPLSNNKYLYETSISSSQSTTINNNNKYNYKY
ncbi:hypothetical protein ACTA71_004143 [Dictyostelium dimigraforme]